MKKLVINVDDAGISEAVNDAVITCYAAGSVTGVSLMAGGVAFGSICDKLKNEKRIEVGVHITLTGFIRPCAENLTSISSLLGPDDMFVTDYTQLFLRGSLKRLRRQHIRTEIAAQIERVRAQGLTVTHLDSHEHVHMLPDVMDVTVDLANEFNIPFVRFPYEDPISTKMKNNPVAMIRYLSLRTFCNMGRDRFFRRGAFSSDNFLGHFHSGRMSEDILTYMIDNLPEGVTELGMHPAHLSEEFTGEFPWYKNASNELDILLSGKWKGHAEREGIILVSHKQAMEG